MCRCGWWGLRVASLMRYGHFLKQFWKFTSEMVFRDITTWHHAVLKFFLKFQMAWLINFVTWLVYRWVNSSFEVDIMLFGSVANMSFDSESIIYYLYDLGQVISSLRFGFPLHKNGAKKVGDHCSEGPHQTWHLGNPWVMAAHPQLTLWTCL